jgi:hypothetical protein
VPGEIEQPPHHGAALVDVLDLVADLDLDDAGDSRIISKRLGRPLG